MKFIIDLLEDVVEPLREQYEKAGDGKFHLKVEGDIPQVVEANGRIAEFRDANIGLNKKVTDFETRLKPFEGVDPNKYHELQTQVDKFEKDGGVKDPADVEKRINDAIIPLQKQITDFQVREQKQKESIALARVEKSLADAALKSGVRDSAVSDFVSRGLRVFNLDGKAMNGDTPLFSKNNPVDALGMEEWAGQLLKEASHLFKESGGGGASNRTEGTGGSVATKRITGEDPLEFGRNLDSIAKGDTEVVR